MMSSQIDHIRPLGLNDKGIHSWFTLRNHLNVNQNSEIPGLNLGINTLESKNKVSNNRELLLKELGIQSDQFAYAKQVHGTKIEIVKNGGEYLETDGLVTTQKGIVLAIQVADCAAILLGDSSNKVIGAAHAGWRGAAGNICNKLITEMIALGAKPNNIKAFISPCISMKNFEVGEEVAVQFPSRFVDRISFDKPHVNLSGFIKEQLQEQGILENNIELTNECTIENEKYYSYRRQKELSGRMMAMIKLN